MFPGTGMQRFGRPRGLLPTFGSREKHVLDMRTPRALLFRCLIVVFLWTALRSLGYWSGLRQSAESAFAGHEARGGRV